MSVFFGFLYFVMLSAKRGQKNVPDFPDIYTWRKYCIHPVLSPEWSGSDHIQTLKSAVAEKSFASQEMGVGSNGDEALSDESPLKSNGDEAFNVDLPLKVTAM
jgi:hypothetical protein